MMGICFGNVLIPPLSIFEKVLSFTTSCSWIEVPGLGVFFGMVGCVLLLVLVGFLLGLLRITISLSLGWRECWVPALKVSVGEWVPSDRFLADLVASDVSDQPDVWAGSFVLDELSGVGVGGCGVYSLKSGAGWFGRRWRHLELLLPGNLGVERCVLFDSVRGPLQSVQRAELSEVILALQCSSAVHLGVDNLKVVRHVSRILDGQAGRKPFGLTIDGDLLTVIERIILQRVLSPSGLLRLRVMRTMTWLLLAGSGLRIRVIMILLTELPILGGVESLIWSWTFVGVLSLPVLFGILLFWSCIGSFLLLLVLRLVSALGVCLGPWSCWSLETWFCWLASH